MTIIFLMYDNELFCDRYIYKYDNFYILTFTVTYVVCFLLGNSPASEFYMPTFQNTLSVPPTCL